MPRDTDRLKYLVLSEAVAAGSATVTEAPRASVPTLQVDNRGPVPVLIVDGEEVAGGLQNRVVNSSLLVPPGTAFELPVTCVEHGRWHQEAPDRTFVPGETVYPKLRAQKLQQVSAAYAAFGEPVADQGAVWDAIATRHIEDGTRSATGAMRDAYRSRDADLARAEARLRYPDGEPVGVVALGRAGVLCADVFDRPGTLRAYWTRLVRSYFLDAAGAEHVPAGAAGGRRIAGSERRRPARPSSGRGDGRVPVARPGERRPPAGRRDRRRPRPPRDPGAHGALPRHRIGGRSGRRRRRQDHPPAGGAPPPLRAVTARVAPVARPRGRATGARDASTGRRPPG